MRVRVKSVRNGVLMSIGVAIITAMGCRSDRTIETRDWGEQPPARRATTEPIQPAHTPRLRAAATIAEPERIVFRGAGQKRLGYWDFNGDDWLVSVDGPRALASSDIERNSSCDGTGLSMSLEGGSRFTVPGVTKDGRPGIDCRNGTIRFMFRPDWSTAGGGPGREAVLVQVGERGKAGYWAWRINAAGSRIEFRQWDPARSAESASFTGDLNLAAGEWYEFTLTYTRTLNGDGGSSKAVVNGRNVVIPGGAHRVWVLPDSRAIAAGVFIGSDPAGASRAGGTFDELELFDFPMFDDKWSEQAGEVGMAAEVATDASAVELRWRNPYGWPMTVRKRSYGENEWVPLLAETRAWSFTDRDVRSGRRYEYSVIKADARDSFRDRYLQVAIDEPPVLERGHLLLLVDETLADDLTDSIETLKRDLTGDGWRVIQRNAPRHDDRGWPNNPPRIAATKAMVDSEFERLGEALKCIYILGHVAIPHSNNAMTPDGHHDRPFQVDFYYGDTVRGEGDWTDSKDWSSNEFPNRIHPFNPPVHNGIGDGYFDQAVLPSKIELAVGRVDFAGLPILTDRPPAGVSKRSEVDLIRDYIGKCHRYRHGQLRFANQVASFRLPLAGFTGETSLSQSVRIANALFGDSSEHLVNANLFHNELARGSLWGIGFGAGYYDRIGVGNSNGWSSADAADPVRETPIGFYMLDGSFFGDWNTDDIGSENNLLRCLLAQQDGGLAAMWGRYNFGDMNLQSIGVGEPLGIARLHDLNSLDRRDMYELVMNAAQNIHLAVLGDPTLRMQVIDPIDTLRANRAGDDVELSWRSVTGEDSQFVVLRSTTGIDGGFDLLTPEPIAETRFLDRNVGGGDVVYQVRAVQSVETGSGRFDCPSQGVFARLD